MTRHEIKHASGYFAVNDRRFYYMVEKRIGRGICCMVMYGLPFALVPLLALVPTGADAAILLISVPIYFTAVVSYHDEYKYAYKTPEAALAAAAAYAKELRRIDDMFVSFSEDEP